MKLLPLLLTGLTLLTGSALPAWSQSHYFPESAPIRDQIGMPVYPGVYYSKSLMFLNLEGNVSRSALQGRVPVNLNIKAPVIVDSNLFLWQTGEKFLGADYCVVANFPTLVQATPAARLELARFSGQGVSGSDFGLYDLYFSPIALGWQGDRYQATFNYGFWAPTGNISGGYWEHQLQLGGTYFLDEEKTWSLSALGTYELNRRNQKFGYTKGNYLTAEWGIVKNLNPNLTLGLVGYGSWQVSQDSGRALPYTPAQDYGYGVGGEVKFTIPEANYLSIGLKYVADIGSSNRLSGSTTTLSLSIPIEMDLPSAPPTPPDPTPGESPSPAQQP